MTGSRALSCWTPRLRRARSSRAPPPRGPPGGLFDDSLEALRTLFRHGPADLLFSAGISPKMDGLEVLKYLRGDVRFHSMGTIALLGERDGIRSA